MYLTHWTGHTQESEVNIQLRSSDHCGPDADRCARSMQSHSTGALHCAAGSAVPLCVTVLQVALQRRPARSRQMTRRPLTRPRLPTPLASASRRTKPAPRPHARGQARERTARLLPRVCSLRPHQCARRAKAQKREPAQRVKPSTSHFRGVTHHCRQVLDMTHYPVHWLFAAERERVAASGR